MPLNRQQRPRQPVHLGRLCGAVGRQRRRHQHGQPWPCLGRHLHRASLAQREAGVRLPEPLRYRRRAMAWPGRILPLLQRWEASPEPRIQDTCKPLSPPKRGGLTQKETKTLPNEKQFVYLQRQPANENHLNRTYLWFKLRDAL